MERETERERAREMGGGERVWAAEGVGGRERERESAQA